MREFEKKEKKRKKEVSTVSRCWVGLDELYAPEYKLILISNLWTHLN
jgi:hypothetical protein